MTVTRAAYRLTVYAASLDPTASTVATPVSAAHSDEFKVTTLYGLAGWKPYLQPPEGRRGRIDPITKRWETGQLTVRLIDAKVSGNLTRWVTAFLGNADAQNPLLHAKAYIEESLDGGSTWSAFFVGRIAAFTLATPDSYDIVLKDFSDDLDEPVFVGRPHSSISYAIEPMLLPVGLSGDYGDVQAAPGLAGTFTAGASLTSGVREITLSAEAATQVYTLARDELRRYVYGYRVVGQRTGSGLTYDIGPTAVTALATTGLRVRFTGGSHTNKELELAGYSIGALRSPAGSTGRAPSNGVAYVAKLYVRAVAATDPYYVAADTTSIPNTTTATLRVLKTQLPTGDAGARVGEVTAWGEPTDIRGEAPTDETPLILASVNPATLAADLLAGKFSRLSASGAVERVFAYDSASVSALTSPSGSRRALPTAHFVVRQQEKLRTVLEEWLCKPYHLAYRLEPLHNAGSPVSRVVLCDMRLGPLADFGSLTTITDADLLSEPIGWTHKTADAATVIEVTGYVDDVLTAEEVAALRDGDGVPSIVQSAPITVVPFDAAELGSTTLGPKTLRIDAPGLRVPAASFVDPTTAVTAEDAITAHAATIRWHYLPMTGWGVMEVTLPCRRTANVAAIQPGQWVYVNVDMLPDPATKVRGGTRLMFVLGREEKGPRLDFELVDAGPFTSSTAPTVGTLAQGAANTKHYVDVPITLGADGDPVIVEAAITGSSTTEPTASDARWHYRRRVVSTGTYSIGPLPSNTNVFIRARSEPTKRLRLPSAWVLSTGTRYVGTAAYTAPSAVTFSPDSTASGTDDMAVSWTNGEASLPVVVDVGGRVVTTYIGLAPTAGKVILPAGSNRLQINSWLSQAPPSTITPMRVLVGHVDRFGGGAWTYADFNVDDTFTGPSLTAPTLEVVRTGGTYVIPGGLNEYRRDRPTGIVLKLSGLDTGFTYVLQRDTASGFTGPVEVGRYSIDATSDGTLQVVVPLPFTTTTHYFRAKTTAPGYSDSGWSSSVNGKSRFLR